MEENKFEKQVQRKMDEFTIHPSESVWEKIEARIGKKKRADRGLIFFLLLFCVLLTGGYWLWITNHHSITAANISRNKDKNKNDSEKTIQEIPAKENKPIQPQTNF